jgi:hypothetical protein
MADAPGTVGIDLLPGRLLPPCTSFDPVTKFFSQRGWVKSLPAIPGSFLGVANRLDDGVTALTQLGILREI